MKPDYNCYSFTQKEILGMLGGYLAFFGVVSWLFYHSFWFLLLAAAGFPIFFRREKIRCAKEQKKILLSQFLTGIRGIANALQAGYSMENAVEEEVKEAEKIYGKDGLWPRELSHMVKELKLNETLETLFLDLGKRSHVEDIENFGEIFAVARKMGGDLTMIIWTTVENISRKAETQEEIAVSLVARKMEQKVMSFIPLFILLYVDLASPEFLEGLYHNPLGIGVMTVCLMVYGFAFVWGRRIVGIEV